jgi:hypothetical protein
MLTYDIQLAGYDYNQYDEKGEVDLQTFMKIIEQFPWIEQLEKYNENQKGCSATISVTNLSTNNSLWISIVGNRNNYNFLIGYVYPKTTKGFLGLGKERIKRWIDIFNIDDFVLIKNYFSLFFNGNEKLLQEHLSKEEKFQSMVAKEK